MAKAVQDQTLQLPSLPPRRPRRRTATIVVAGIVGGLAVSGLSVAALRNDARTVRSETVATIPPTTAASPPTTATPETTVAPRPAVTSPPTTAAPPATVAPERLTSQSRLRVDGLGPVRIGMTLNEASAAAGVAIRLHPGESGGLDCSYAYAASGLDEVGFMVVGGRIVRIDVGHKDPARVKTLSGIGKGSTEAEVMRAYPGQIRVEGHPYVEGAHNLVYVPADPAFRPYSMIFESIDGRVARFRSGLADPVGWIEGCS